MTQDTSNNQKYIIGKDNIIRRSRKGRGGRTVLSPACPNEWYQPLLVALQKAGRLPPAEDTLYGQCILSLVEIILNNAKFKYQDQDIKDECRGAALECIVTNVPMYYDPSKGKAYSFAFRCGYTAMIKVLEAWNERRETEVSLDDIGRDFITNLTVEDLEWQLTYGI